MDTKSAGQKIYNIFTVFPRMGNILKLITIAACWAVANTTPLASNSSMLSIVDSFYSLPADLENEKPGTILRSRTPPSQLVSFGISPVRLQAHYQLLYRTTDSLGAPTATVLTVLVPFNADFGKVLSYQLVEDASYGYCAPSVIIQESAHGGKSFDALLSQIDFLRVELSLNEGWVVILPDYEGPNSAFLANRLAGQAVLDGIRAALASGSVTNIEKKATVGLWGYSGGSLPTSWATELQPSYAPELSIAGAASGGVVPNIANTLYAVNKQGPAGLIAAGLAGLSNQYPELDLLVQNHILPQFRPLLSKPHKQCFIQNTVDFFNKDVIGMIDDPDLIDQDPARQILDANNLGKVIPSIPLYIYKAKNDTVSPTADTDQLVQFYCSGGASLHYGKDILADHVSLAATAEPKVFSWLVDVMNGVKPQTGCTSETLISSLFDPSAVKTVPKVILSALRQIASTPVGPP